MVDSRCWHRPVLGIHPMGNRILPGSLLPNWWRKPGRRPYHARLRNLHVGSLPQVVDAKYVQARKE